MTFTNIGAARDAIMGQFATQWAIRYPSNPPFVVYPDALAETPVDDQPWVRLMWNDKLGYQATINTPGNRRFRAKGTLIVEIRTPIGDGLTTSDAITDNVQGIFEGQTVPGQDAVIFRDVTVTEPGPDGAWFLVRVLVNYEYDRRR